MQEISSQPLVVATVSNEEDLAKLDQGEIQLACDCLEFRLDSLSANQLLPETERLMLRGLAPALVTVRHHSEGGDGELSADARAQLYRRYLELAWAIDIEIGTLGDLADVAAEAKAGKPLLVASFHDFDQLPENPLIQDKIDAGIEAGADIVKIAARLHSPDDMIRLVSFLESEKRVPLSVMGMGSLGTASRLLAAESGSVLNYGFLTRANAPGQCAAEILKRLISS